MSEDDQAGRQQRAATRLVTAGRRREWVSAPDTRGHVVSPPVWRASTHLYDGVAELNAAAARNADGDFYYGRRGAPTQWALADALTEMEPGAAGTMLFPSGVAAVHSALLSVLSPGDVLLVTDNAYGPSQSFADGFLKSWDVATRYFDPMVSGADIDGIFCERTRAVLLESPGSLTFEVQDVPAIAAAARARGVVSLIDNTWATPHFFPALSQGVDISILAGTKYIGGHSDIMLGSVTATAEHYPSIRKTAQALGQVVSPDDAWLGLRGLRTLDVRLRRHEAGALEVAKWLAAHDKVLRVLHPALPECPGHTLWKRDFTGASGLFAFEIDGDAKAAERFIDALTLFGIGYSWGGFESLAIPADPKPARKAAPGERRGSLIRLHIGLEDPADLIGDLAAAFDTGN